MIVKVCIGSSCHLKGSYLVIQTLQQLIAQHHLDKQVAIKAEFCMGKCTHGIPMEIDGRQILDCRVDSVYDIFQTFVLDALEVESR